MNDSADELFNELRNLLGGLRHHVGHIESAGQSIFANGGAVRVTPPPPPIKEAFVATQAAQNDLTQIDAAGQAIAANGGAVRVTPPPPPIKDLLAAIEAAQHDLKSLAHVVPKLAARGMLSGNP